MPIQISITPLDTLFFRDNRPFDAGNDGYAETVLPSPLTLFGIVGSYYLEQKGISLARFQAEGDDKLGVYDPELKRTKLKLLGPFFQRDGEIYLPPPANLWCSQSTPYWLLPYEEHNRCNDQSLRTLRIPPFPSRAEAEPCEDYLSATIAAGLLNQGKVSSRDLRTKRYSEEELFCRETRVGHAVCPDRNTVEEGLLYSARHLRFKEVHAGNELLSWQMVLIAEGLECEDIPDGVASVGGEGRLARIEAETFSGKLVPADEEVLVSIREKKRFFLYFITPAIFNKGWKRERPPDFEGAELVSAAINKPRYVSGWKKHPQGAGGTPRGMHTAVPAGSVYFFEAPAWDAKRFDDFYAKYHCGASLSEHYPNAGFGTALVGAW